MDDVLFAPGEVTGDNKTLQVNLNHDYNMTFLISSKEF